MRMEYYSKNLSKEKIRRKLLAGIASEKKLVPVHFT
jgi:hypothetical protein